MPLRAGGLLVAAPAFAAFPTRGFAIHRVRRDVRDLRPDDPARDRSPLAQGQGPPCFPKPVAFAKVLLEGT